MHDGVDSLVLGSSSPLEDRPLEHAGCAGSSAHSKLIHTAGEVPEFPACSDVEDIEDHGGLFPGVAGVLAAVCDEVLLIWAEVHQTNLKHTQPFQKESGMTGSLRLDLYTVEEDLCYACVGQELRYLSH